MANSRLNRSCRFLLRQSYVNTCKNDIRSKTVNQNFLKINIGTMILIHDTFKLISGKKPFISSVTLSEKKNSYSASFCVIYYTKSTKKNLNTGLNSMVFSE